MNSQSAELSKLFEAADVGWVFDHATNDEPPDEIAARILQHILDIEVVLERSFPTRSRPILVAEIRADVERFRPLIQAFASPVTAEMCAMIYTVLDSADVIAIRFVYEFKNYVHLVVAVEYESGERAEFTSNEAWDVEVLHHFGIMKTGGKPVIDGYYAFRKAVE